MGQVDSHLSKAPVCQASFKVFTQVSGARAAHLLTVILGEDGVADLGELAPGQGDWEARGPLTTVMPAVQLPEFKWRGWPRTLAPSCHLDPKRLGRGAFLFKENTVSIGDGKPCMPGQVPGGRLLSTVLRMSVKVDREGLNTVIGCHPDHPRLCLDLLPAISFTLPTVFPSLLRILLM